MSPLALVLGFILDTLYLTRRVDLLETNLLLGSYLVIAAIGIALLNAVEEGRVRTQFILSAAPAIPVIAQFAFGGLFSGYLSLYGRSATFVESWVFVVVVAILLVGNERFLKLYMRIPFQVSIYFTALYSFFIFFLPLVFHRIDVQMFLLAGAVSVGITLLFLILLSRIAPERMRAAFKSSVISVAFICGLFNLLYFANLIPPLPLSLKDAGVYHRVERLSDGSYQALAESRPWHESFLHFKTVFHLVPGDNIYVFSAIFAPTNLSTAIAYEWQYRHNGAWKTVSTIPFTISGGRDGGFRSYGVISNAAAGEWRVNVRTSGGRLLGRIPFTVVLTADPPDVVTEEK